MKTRFSYLLILLLLIVALTACAADQPTEVATEQTEITTGQATEANPSNAAYPVEEFIVPTVVDSSAYPITEDDLQMLIGSWSLTNYSENGKSLDAGKRIVKFNEDGTYEVTSDTGTMTGEWNARLFAVESTLILNPGSENAVTFNIDELNQSVLKLSITLDGVKIEEGYLPAE